MSISHVRDSFNAAAAGKATAERAFLGYELKHDVEYQVLRFEGSYADGSPMSFSVDCRPGSDPVVEAATAVQSLPDPVPVEKPVVVQTPVEAPVPVPPEPVAPIINVQCSCTCTCAPAPVQVADPGPTPEPPTPTPVLAPAPAAPEQAATPVDPAPAPSEEVSQ